MILTRGDVWLADLDPTRGHEQAGRRPVLLVSQDLLHRGPSGLAIVVPITARIRRIASHVVVSPPEGGLGRESAILCEAVRSVSTSRLSRRFGSVSPTTMGLVEDVLRILIGL